MNWWQRLSIRARLALFFAGAISLILMAYAIYVAAFVHKGLKAETIHRLDQEVEIIERSLRLDNTGQLVWYAPHEMHEAYQPLRNVSWLDIHRPDGALLYRVPETRLALSESLSPSNSARRRGSSLSTGTPRGYKGASSGLGVTAYCFASLFAGPLGGATRARCIANPLIRRSLCREPGQCRSGEDGRAGPQGLRVRGAREQYKKGQDMLRRSLLMAAPLIASKSAWSRPKLVLSSGMLHRICTFIKSNASDTRQRADGRRTLRFVTSP